jgi:phosphoglycolate phosphatase-like HAD superfamily hydrolase
MRNWSEPESTAHDGIGFHACTFARQERPRVHFRKTGSSMKARWLFFDLDGTLVDSIPGLRSSIIEALGSSGRMLAVENLRPYIGPGIQTILKNLEAPLTEAELDGMERLVTRRGLTFLQAGQKHLPEPE